VTRAFDPWAADKPGAWYRVRTARGAAQSWTDVGLKHRADGELTLVAQTCSKTPAEPESEQRVSLVAWELAGEDALRVGDRTIALDVWTAKDRREWRVRDGRHAGLVVRRAADPAVRALREDTLAIGGRAFDCLVVESADGTAWLSASFPLGAVRFEGPGVKRDLVEFGDDWVRRPGFPIESERARLARIMRDADHLVRATDGIRREFAARLSPLPDDADALRLLLEQTELVLDKLDEARRRYQSVEESADGWGLAERELKSLDGVSASLRLAADRIRAKLR